VAHLCSRELTAVGDVRDYEAASEPILGNTEHVSSRFATVDTADVSRMVEFRPTASHGIGAAASSACWLAVILTQQLRTVAGC
jgi:hypothetical protein